MRWRVAHEAGRSEGTAALGARRKEWGHRRCCAELRASEYRECGDDGKLSHLRFAPDRSARPSGIAPHLARQLDHLTELGPLLGFAEVIALGRARKTALRAQGELIQAYVAARRLDTLPYHGLILER